MRAASIWMACALLLAPGCRDQGDESSAGGAATRDRLRARLAKVAAADPLIVEALAVPADVVVGIRPALAEDVLKEVAARYFDRVALDLALEKRVEEQGEVEIKVLFGNVKAGVWTLELVVHRVSGVLRLRAPRLKPGDGRLNLEAPVRLENAQGTATVHFRWDARSLAGAVCRDFEVTRTLRGRALAREYTIAGAFELFAGPEMVRVRPAFPPQTVRIQVDLAPESWADVEQAIAEQDRLLKCGLALNPEKVLGKLKTLLRAGFEVKLPHSLFRTVDFPAAVQQRVTVEDRQVDLAVKTSGLRVTPGAVWFGAEVRTVVK